MSTVRIVSTEYDDDLPVDPEQLDLVAAARGYANQAKDHRDATAQTKTDAQGLIDGFGAVVTQAQDDVGAQVTIAAGHAAAALASKDQAGAEKDLAAGWADTAADTDVPGAGLGTRSAKHHATKAAADRAAVAADRTAVADLAAQAQVPVWYLGASDAMDLPLPSPAIAGKIAFAKSGRKAGEKFSSGTGERMICDGELWTPLLRDEPLPIVQFDFAAAKHLPTAAGKQITHPRAGHATMVDATGKITFAPNNVFSHANDITNAAWNKSGSVTAPAVDRLLEGAAAGGKHIYRTVTAGAPTRYTLQFKAKPDGRGVVFVNASYTGTTNWVAMSFDLATGAASAVSSGAGAPPSIIAHTVAATGVAGEYLISVTFAVSGALVYYYIGMSDTAAPVYSADYGLYNYAGDGVQAIKLRDIQLERVTYETAPRAFNPTVSAAYYGPRLTHDPATLESLGLLLEPIGSNHYPWSISPANWVTSSGGVGIAPAVTLNDAAAPNGLTEATKVVFDLNGGTVVGDWSVLTLNVAGLTAAQAYTGAFWIRATNPGDVGKKIAFRHVGNAVSMAVVLTDAWQKVRLTETAAGTSANITIGLWGDGSGVAPMPDTVEIHMWQPQLESGTEATSEIFTGGAAVTRAAETATLTGDNFSPWFNPLEGTVIIDAINTGPGGNSYYWSLSNGGGSEAMYAFYAGDGGTTVRPLYVYDGGIGQAALADGLSGKAVRRKIASAYKLNDFAASVDGGAVQTDAAGTLPTVDRLHLGGSTIGGVGYPIIIRNFAYFNTRLANAALQEIATP